MEKKSELCVSASPRERLLAAAEALIYAGGIHATGVDAIVRKAATGRKSFYTYFHSKEALIAAALKGRDERWMNWFIAGTVQHKDYKERLIAMFDVLRTWFASEDFHGCAFLNAAGEISDPNNPIRVEVRKHKEQLLEFVQLQSSGFARSLGLSQDWAAQLSRQFLILIDGAISVALVNGDPDAAIEAQVIATQLLSAAMNNSVKHMHKAK